MIGYYNYTVILTYLGFTFSVTGILLLTADNKITIPIAILLLLLSGLCDMFDGRVARTMKRDSMQENFGVQIDSLSDLVCFGIFPACILFRLTDNALYFIPLLVIFVLCGLVRLAYFNVRMIEKKYNPVSGIGNEFIGLPITCSSLLVPLLFAFKPLFIVLFVQHAQMAYNIFIGIAIFLCSLAFISPFRIKKPGKRGIILLILLGTFILILACVSYGLLGLYFHNM